MIDQLEKSAGKKMARGAGRPARVPVGITEFNEEENTIIANKVHELELEQQNPDEAINYQQHYSCKKI